MIYFLGRGESREVYFGKNLGILKKYNLNADKEKGKDDR